MALECRRFMAEWHGRHAQPDGEGRDVKAGERGGMTGLRTRARGDWADSRYKDPVEEPRFFANVTMSE